MPLSPTIGHMKEDSERAEWWRSIYGSLDVPLSSPIPYKSRTDGGDVEDYYQIDLERLTEAQIEKICEFMAATFGQPIDVIRASIRGSHGLPVRMSEFSGVTFDARLVS